MLGKTSCQDGTHGKKFHDEERIVQSPSHTLPHDDKWTCPEENLPPASEGVKHKDEDKKGQEWEESHAPERETTEKHGQTEEKSLQDEVDMVHVDQCKDDEYGDAEDQ